MGSFVLRVQGDSLPVCIHNSIDAQLKHGTFLFLEHCHRLFNKAKQKNMIVCFRLLTVPKFRSPILNILLSFLVYYD